MDYNERNGSYSDDELLSRFSRPETPRNHCDLNTVIALNEVIGCPQVILTHISHQFDVWMMDNPLPSGIEAGYDGMVLVLD